MTELPADSSGNSNLLRGWELEAWRGLRVKHGLKDSLCELGAATGPHFTWRRRRGNVLERSCFDRFYLGEEGWWLHGINELIHDGSQALLLHDPVILKVVLGHPPPLDAASGARFSTYFKAKADILKKCGTHGGAEAGLGRPHYS
ncbi:unnamed protein product [Calypogeia fissa]